MLIKEIQKILKDYRKTGWVFEPDAKRILGMADLEIPRFAWARRPEEALTFARSAGYPVVAKVISTEALHKSDVGGVIVGIKNEQELEGAFERLQKIKGCEGILVEETLAGVELIVGSKIDEQFGPVILLGVGGIAVEVYRDTVIRLAPLEERDVSSMIRGLTARRLLEGYRGTEPVNIELLTALLMKFSNLVRDLESHIESIDLNPVMCTSRRCVVADARIILKKHKKSVSASG
ncbi:MAG: acetate--CoA ligase family protein [Candidatus Krumholzibacteriota bacterium]|nr:acetate--CoA ligase family protein [Candidatus Krumholzibacteriota bacterium]